MVLSLINQFSDNGCHFYKASVDLDNDIRNFSKEINMDKLTIFGFNKHFLPMQIASPLAVLYSLKYLRSADIVLEIPGEIPDDISFYSQFFRFLAAKFFKKRFIICGCSLGPFRFPLTVILARFLFKRVEALLVRELVTSQYLKKIGVKNFLLTSDHTFLLTPLKSDRIRKFRQKVGSFIGLTVKHEYFYGCRNYKIAMEELINYLTKDLKLSAVLIPHGREDVLPSRIIYRESENDKVYLLEGNFSPRELKWLISQADFFVGSRIHACIAALSSGVPTIVFIPHSDHRSLGFMSEFGLQDVVVDPYSKESLLFKFKKYYQRKDELRKAIILKLPQLRKRASLNTKVVRGILKNKKME